MYALPEYLTTDRMRKKKPLCDQLIGILYCVVNDIMRKIIGFNHISQMDYQKIKSKN